MTEDKMEIVLGQGDGREGGILEGSSQCLEVAGREADCVAIRLPLLCSLGCGFRSLSPQ